VAWIEIRGGMLSGTGRREVDDGLILGRSDECDVVLDDSAVSAKHAWIRRVGDHYTLIDLRSTNGVVLNGERVDEAVLRDGDTFSLGEVVCRFHDRDRRGDMLADQPANPCPVCGFLVPGGISFCPRCGQEMVGSTAAASGNGKPSLRVREFVRAMSSLAFAGGLVGPLLLGIGWILGIVLGIMVLSGYRSECEPGDERMARLGILLGLLWLTLGAWLAVYLRR